ncbi:MAG TPA: EamA family transporter, partial [Acidimicrobiales bacterium]|nr:EamA family transporter [Acidimicrobiales bacterium]
MSKRDVAWRTGTGSRAPAGSERVALAGTWVAAITALVSGVSVFVNSYGVHAVAPPAAYTTAKNFMAALFLGVAIVAAAGLRRTRRGSAAHRFLDRPVTGRADGSDRGRARLARWLGLGYVGVVGGGVAFILFFDGLADTTPTPAAFLHDGLVVWVGFLALPLLRERLHVWNFLAIALLMGGQVAVLGGVGQLTANRGDLLVLGATWLWAVEVVVCKRLLADLAPATVSLTRMGVGAALLFVYLAATGSLSVLGSLTLPQVGWVTVTGLLLAGYVGTWMTALSRARAVDVTAVLVGSTVITSLLSAMAGTLPVAPA